MDLSPESLPATIKKTTPGKTLDVECQLLHDAHLCRVITATHTADTTRRKAAALEEVDTFLHLVLEVLC